MIITFGRYGHVEDEKKEKEYFLVNLNELIYQLSGYSDPYPKYNEIEIVKPFKDLFIRKINSTYFNSIYYSCLSSFLKIMGLCYYTLTPKEKEDILDMDFTYENFKEKSPSIINNFIKRVKKEFPSSLSSCADDIYFIFHIQFCYQESFSFKNFIEYIRDYYILDETIPNLQNYRDDKKYKEMQKKVIDIYPEIKEKYGMNRILEKFISFFTPNTDYHSEKTKKILNDYYEKKKNKNYKIENDETIKLKEKED